MTKTFYELMREGDFYLKTDEAIGVGAYPSFMGWHKNLSAEELKILDNGLAEFADVMEQIGEIIMKGISEGLEVNYAKKKT